MTRSERPAVRHVAAVERAVAVLDVLTGGDLGTNEVARRTGLTPSSASRQLATLAAAGLVERVESSGRYRLGLRLVELGDAALARVDVRDLVRSHLHALVAATGETATLSVPGGAEAITVDFVQSPHSVRSVAQLGRPSVGHATATGKVMLAFGGGAVPVGPLERYTERTVTDIDALERELERTRTEGWAAAVDERELGLAAIAAPVLGRDRALVAVLGVQGLSERFQGRSLAAAVEPLLERARIVSAALGRLDRGFL